MSAERMTPQDPRMRGAVQELQGLITARYPQASFEVSAGEDPEGVYLTATVDTDDLTTVLEVVGDRLVDLQVEEGLPVYVVPMRPLARVLAEMRSSRRPARPRVDWGASTPPGQP